MSGAFDASSDEIKTSDHETRTKVAMNSTAVPVLQNRHRRSFTSYLRPLPALDHERTVRSFVRLLHKSGPTSEVDSELKTCAVRWWFLCVAIFVLFALYTVVSALQERQRPPLATYRKQESWMMPNLVLCGRDRSDAKPLDPLLAAVMVSWTNDTGGSGTVTIEPPPDDLHWPCWWLRTEDLPSSTQVYVVALQNMSRTSNRIPQGGIYMYSTGAHTFAEWDQSGEKHDETGNLQLLGGPMNGTTLMNEITYNLVKETHVHFPRLQAQQYYHSRYLAQTTLVWVGRFRDPTTWNNWNPVVNSSRWGCVGVFNGTDGSYHATDDQTEILTGDLVLHKGAWAPRTGASGPYEDYFATLAVIHADSEVTTYEETDPFSLYTVLGAVGGYTSLPLVLFGMVFILKASGIRRMNPWLATAWRRLHECWKHLIGAHHRRDGQDRTWCCFCRRVKTVLLGIVPPPPASALVLSSGEDDIHDQLLHQRIDCLERQAAYTQHLKTQISVQSAHIRRLEEHVGELIMKLERMEGPVARRMESQV